MKDNYIYKLKKYIKNPQWIVVFLNNKNIYHINDKAYISLLYKLTFQKKLNLDNPNTFNEKLQWLKLNDRKDEYTTMVDKYEAKEYVASIIGKEYLVPTLGVYNNFDDINFEKLPKKFVIKCTHDSGGLVICKNKDEINIKEAKRKINKSLKVNYYQYGREWPYKNVKPRIIIEKYIEDEKTKETKDYKFFCFNGSVKCFKIDFNRNINHQANYYDTNGNLLEFGEVMCPPDYQKKIDLPYNLKEMISFAELLSKDIPFLRVDFYEINQKIYFGELTFYPAAGFGKFTDEKWDRIMGDWIELPTDKK